MCAFNRPVTLPCQPKQILLQCNDPLTVRQQNQWDNGESDTSHRERDRAQGILVENKRKETQEVKLRLWDSGLD